MAGEHFPSQQRLRRAVDFRRVYARRCSAADRSLVVYGLPNDGQRPRLGLSVSRKVGMAVVRNRWKRLLREAFRHSGQQLPSGLDLIVIPRNSAPPSLADLQRSLVMLALQVARKLRLRPAPVTEDEGDRHE